MKRQIIFNLDEYLVDKLKAMDNRSLFLNELLTQYFKDREFDDLTLEDIQTLLKLEDSKTELLNKIKDIDKEIKKYGR
jgi:6-phosphogluconolactonase/glucosamine-6-phosphate isomerase/deaminase